MTRFLVVLISLWTFVAKAQVESASGMSASKRLYPGGLDDSDLTVQVLKKITKKDDSTGDYHDHDGDVEFNAGSPDSDFGE